MNSSVYVYLVPRSSYPRVADARAAVACIRETYPVRKTGLAAMGMGLLIATERQIDGKDADALGIVEYN